MKAAVVFCTVLMLASCQKPEKYYAESNRVAAENLRHAQMENLGYEEPLHLRTPEEKLRRRLLVGQNLPTADPASLGCEALPFPTEASHRFYLDEASQSAVSSPLPEGAVVLDLKRALLVAAANNREYQSQKEMIFKVALELDLEHDRFGGLWSAMAQSQAVADLHPGSRSKGNSNSASLTYSQQTRRGPSFSGGIGLDLVKLLNYGKTSSLGITGDLSISIPLLRGSSSFVLSEPLRQAERNLVYAIYQFERYKQVFAVGIATSYLETLAELNRIETSVENYRSLMVSTRRARRLADAGRLPEVQVDQAHQDELRARQTWISSTQSYQRRLDQFKMSLGLPVDANVALDPASLGELEAEMKTMMGNSISAISSTTVASAEDLAAALSVSPAGGPWEWSEAKAVRTALDKRRDLRVVLGQVYDAMHLIAVAEDDLRADLTLLGSGQAGAHRSLQQAGLADGQLRPEQGVYSLLLSINLPLHRVAERNTYRNSWLNLEAALRNLQDLEDQVKLNVRNDLRVLMEAREQARIQVQSLALAERRVASMELFLQAGRAQIRDLLDAQESLVSSRNQRISAMIRYRSAEWQLQADLGILQVGIAGLANELTGETQTAEASGNSQEGTNDHE